MKSANLLSLLLPGIALNVAAVTNQIYFNNFNSALGTGYPEWSSSPITYVSRASPPGSGTIPSPPVTNTFSPNHAQQFLGLFGGPRIGTPGDPGYNRTRVDQTIRLFLANLPPHTELISLSICTS